ncbi:hypothetical protein COCON_G00223050 [Conger conger]|uniref:Uncharacterized protein n=1 Tax=Conger conger TaxID=82655 RepID=A0A9Q1HN80_CONCO|nr:hypothetical protein COCON_G00223050 [Conger conger]
MSLFSHHRTRGASPSPHFHLPVTTTVCSGSMVVERPPRRAAGERLDGRGHCALRRSPCAMPNTAPIPSVAVGPPAFLSPRDTPASVPRASPDSTGKKLWPSAESAGCPSALLGDRTDLQLQFQARSPEGITFYTAQHLGVRAGVCFCVSLRSSLVLLRYSLWDTVDGVCPGGYQRREVAYGAGGPLQEPRQPDAGCGGGQGAGGMPGGHDRARCIHGRFRWGVPSLTAVPGCTVGSTASEFSGRVREAVQNGRQLGLRQTLFSQQCSVSTGLGGFQCSRR